jgi:hypothetical protein
MSHKLIWNHQIHHSVNLGGTIFLPILYSITLHVIWMIIFLMTLKWELKKLPCYEFQYLFQNSSVPCVLKLKCQNCMLMILKPRPLLLKKINNFNQSWMVFFPYHINMTRFCDVTHNYRMSKMGFEPSHPQQEFALTIPPPMVTNNIITKNPWRFYIILNVICKFKILI